MTGYHRIVVGNGAGSSGTPYRPESLSFVSAADSSNGQNLLIVGFEGDGTNAVSEQIAVYSVVPEPSAAWLLGAVGLAAALRRRRAGRMAA